MRVKYLYQPNSILIVAATCMWLGLNTAYYSDDTVVRLLDSPTVIEQWETGTLGHAAKQTTIEEPALLKQAKLFANFLNPPQPRAKPHDKIQAVTRQKRSAQSSSARFIPPVRPPTVAPTFVLLATSCYPANPTKSLALIDEPGRGQRWIRPGTHLGHLIVETIDKGSIVYRDGDTRHTMARTTVEQKPSDRDGPPNRPYSPDQGESYVKSVANGKQRDVSHVRPTIKRPSFQRLGPKR